MSYLNAVTDNFGDDADYAQIFKIGGKPHQRKYSPTQCQGVKKKKLI